MRMLLRSLFASRVFSVAAIGTIALAISLAATVFAVVDGVLFKPLPYRDADRLFHLAGTDDTANTGRLAPSDVDYLRAADPGITITTFASNARGLRSADRPEVVLRGAAIERSLFDVLGQRPLVGGFTAEHGKETATLSEGEPAIISYQLWRERLGGDPIVIGRLVDFIDKRLLIVGVLPPDFVFPEALARFRPDVLVMLAHAPAELNDRWARSLFAVARVDRALSAREAKAKLDAALATRADQYPPRPNTIPGPYVGVTFRALGDILGRNERPLFRTAFAGAVLLIVLGCVSVAGLLAVRGRDREREFSVRIALGAKRRQLAALLLIEAVSVGLLGALLGVLLARPLVSLTPALLPENVLLIKPPVIDWRVVAFAIAAAVASMTTVSALTAASILRGISARGFAVTPTSTLRMRSWTRAVILAGETAIALALLVAGALVIASYVALRAEDPGFERDNLAVLDVVALGASRTPSPEEARLRQERILARLEAVPGVTGVAHAATPLLENSSNGSIFQSPPRANSIFVNDIPISGAFFDVARIRLLDGRLPTAQEIDAGRPVAIVSARTAEAYWPGRRAVGETLTGDSRTVVTVVAVVAEARFSSQAETMFGEIYLPMALRWRPSTVFFMRTSHDPSVVARHAAQALNREVPGIIVRRAESFDAALAKSVRLFGFRGVLFAATGIAGLLVVAVGVGGLVAMGVARRVREIGIRATLGARRAAISRMIVFDHLRPVIAGCALGLLASWWTTKLLSRFLYGFTPHDPLIWAAASALLLIVAMLSAWLPARRASAVDPAVVLRVD